MGSSARRIGEIVVWVGLLTLAVISCSRSSSDEIEKRESLITWKTRLLRRIPDETGR